MYVDHTGCIVLRVLASEGLRAGTIPLLSQCKSTGRAGRDITKRCSLPEGPMLKKLVGTGLELTSFALLARRSSQLR